LSIIRASSLILRSALGMKLLPAEAGIDAHHQHQVDIIQIRSMRALAGVCGIEHDAGALAQRLIVLERAVRCGPASTWMLIDVGAGLGEGLEDTDRRARSSDGRRRLLRVRANRLHHHRADRDVGHEMPVHHIDMDPVGAGGVDRAHLLAQLRAKSAERIDGAMRTSIMAKRRGCMTDSCSTSLTRALRQGASSGDGDVHLCHL
jgi:hypothetical protein